MMSFSMLLRGILVEAERFIGKQLSSHSKSSCEQSKPRNMSVSVFFQICILLFYARNDDAEREQLRRNLLEGFDSLGDCVGCIDQSSSLIFHICTSSAYRFAPLPIVLVSFKNGTCLFTE